MRIAAVSDLHYNKTCRGRLEPLFRSASDEADVLLLCGDLTDHGLGEEAEILAEDLEKFAPLTKIAILGNHDFESSRPEVVRQVLEDVGVKMLDGESHVVDSVGFAGTCGFAGGFDKWALNPWGEQAIKLFVQACVDETLKLETALSRMECDTRVVLLHYSPIRETVQGEPPEIYPFLGSSRLEDPLNHYDVAVAFHGHAHHGKPEGRTSRDVPVFNVSLPVLRALDADGPGYRLIDTSDFPSPDRTESS